jgi:hypothetical protein
MIHQIYKSYRVFLNGRYAGLVRSLNESDAARVFRETATVRVRPHDKITSIAA